MPLKALLLYLVLRRTRG